MFNIDPLSVFGSLSTLIISIIIILAVWELAWKGIALWKCGRRNQIKWFVPILIFNTAGLLPIIYLLLNRGKKYKK